MSKTERGSPEAFDASTRRALEAILRDLASGQGVRGLSIINRTGQPLVSHGDAQLDSQLLYPLLATLAEAGHNAVAELDAKPDVRVAATSDRTRLHIAGIDEDFLLVTIADNAKEWSTIRPRVNDARQRLRARIALGVPRPHH